MNLDLPEWVQRLHTYRQDQHRCASVWVTHGGGHVVCERLPGHQGPCADGDVRWWTVETET